MQNQLYKVYSKEKDQIIGVLHLIITEEMVHNHYKKTGNITIKSYAYTIPTKQPFYNVFFASYRDDSIGKIANISSEDPHGKGDIIFNMDQLRGLRIGSLIMYLKTQWLKKLDEDFPVKGIHFKPQGSVIRAQKFYENFGVPITGSMFHIADLKLHTSWEQNIEEIKIENLDQLISDLADEERLLIKKIEYLEQLNSESRAQIHKFNIFNFWIPKKFIDQSEKIKNITSDVHNDLSGNKLEDKIVNLNHLFYHLPKLHYELAKKRKNNQKENYYWSLSQTPFRFRVALGRLFNQLLLPGLVILIGLAFYFNYR